MKRRGFIRSLLAGVGGAAIAKEAEANPPDPKPAEPSNDFEVHYWHPQNVPVQPALGDGGIIFAPEVKKIFLDGPKDGRTVYRAMSDFLDRPENMHLEAPFHFITPSMFEMNDGWRFAAPCRVKAALINHGGDLALIDVVGYSDVRLRWQLDDGPVHETEYRGSHFFHVKGSGTLKVWTDSPWPTWYVDKISGGFYHLFPIAPPKIPTSFNDFTLAMMQDHVYLMKKSLGEELALKEIRRHEKPWWYA